MVNMTNSLYTQQQTNIKKESESSNDFMDINADEAEAGTILMSLSQQTKKKPTTKTMSISNLLGEEKEEEIKQTKWNNADINNIQNHHHTKSILLSNDMHRFPETTKEIHSHIYPERLQYNNNHIIHQSSPLLPPHPTATASLPLPPPSRHRSDSIHHQQQQQQQQQQNRYIYSNSSPPKKSFHDQPTSSLSQQPLQSMRSNPKVKRNALHAYISYMTYSDMTKQKSNNPMNYQHHSISNSTIMNPPPITPLPTNFSLDRSSTIHPHQPLPLTAYLKQHIDTRTHSSTSSSTSSSSSTTMNHPIRQRTYSNGWSNPNYSNDTSSSTYPFQYYSSMKHPYDKNS